MDILITVESGGYQLIDSGTLLTFDNQPVLMTVEIGEEQVVSVALHFHNKKHPDGKALVRGISIDGTVDEWHLYDSGDNTVYTVEPVPVTHFQQGEEVVTLFLQIHAQKISTGGTIKLDYCWFEGRDENPTEAI